MKYIFINIYISIKYNNLFEYLNIVTMMTLDEFEILKINLIKIYFLRK